MAEKRSIYMGEPLRRLFARRRDDDSVTGAVNTVVERYLESCRRSVPDLSRQEWCAVLDATNGLWLAADAGLAVRGIPLEVADACRLNGLAGKWGVDGDALVRRLADLPFASLVAIAEVSEAFWARAAEPTDDALRRALEEW